MEQKLDDRQFDAEKLGLTQLLRQYDIDTTLWGAEGAKTVNHLVKEIMSHECQLVENGGELLRIVSIAEGVITYINSDGVTYRLHKQEQASEEDNRTRTRPYRSYAPVSEKMVTNEEPLSALMRGINDELGIATVLSVYKTPEIKVVSSDSLSFPGLSSVYKFHTYSVSIDRSVYKPKGYQKVQPDKTNYYVWERIESPRITGASDDDPKGDDALNPLYNVW